ncbi:MAG TPA: response regulator [Quisquiliibacterium sp.]|nr:response regulator [Quisquiliibacterium sp.]
MKPSPEKPRTDTVLVVDDAPDTLRWLCDLLEQEGYTVLVARSGAEALTRLDYVVPDAILLDGMMPGLSGFETCTRIKANPAWSHVPVIFMTGMGETGDIVQGFDSGAVDYVVKPVRAEEVLARLATHVRNARVARLARDAVDFGGLGVLMVDARARIAWRSPQAERWLAECFEAAGGEPSSDWLQQAAGLSAGEELAAGGASGQQLVARSLGRAGLDETMLLLTRRDAAGGREDRIGNASLTPRETEVLSWVAKGKTNRDIAEILGMSPRTVNKHLEHVFEKLGVETRAAAAALASRSLG